MIIDYPAVLPCFQRSGYSYQHFDTHQRTEFNSGYVRQRRKPSGPVTFSVTAKFTDAELEIFEAWREHDLQDIGWFNADLLTGSGSEKWVVQFVSKSFPNNSTGGGKWELGFQVMARKARFIDQAALYEKLYDLPDDFGTQTQNALNNLYQD